MPLLYFTVRAAMRPDKSVTNNEGLAQDMLFRPFYTFPEIWYTTTYWASWLTYFVLSYLAVWMISTEYDNRTMRQNIITGVSRRSLFLSKVGMMVMLSLAATLYVLLVTLAVGWWEGGYGYWFGEESLVLGRFFVQTLFYMSLATFLAILTRKSGLTMLIFFAYLLIVERVIRYLVFGQLLDNLFWGSYWPGNAASDTLPLYVVKRFPDFMDSGMLDIYLSVEVATACTIGYTLLFFGLAYRIFMKRDL